MERRVEDDTNDIDSHIVIGQFDVNVQAGTVRAAGYDGAKIEQRMVWITGLGTEIGTERIVRIRGYLPPQTARELALRLIEAAGVAREGIG